MFSFLTTVTLAQTVTIRTSNEDAVFVAPGRSQTLLTNSTGARRVTLEAGTEVVLCGRHKDNAFFFAFRTKRNEPFAGIVVRPKAFDQLVAALIPAPVVEVAPEDVTPVEVDSTKADEGEVVSEGLVTLDDAIDDGQDTDIALAA